MGKFASRENPGNESNHNAAVNESGALEYRYERESEPVVRWPESTRDLKGSACNHPHGQSCANPPEHPSKTNPGMCCLAWYLQGDVDPKAEKETLQNVFVTVPR